MTSPSLGAQIKAARKRANMTQGDVAEALSISVQAVSQWETDKTIPNFKNLSDLKKMIGLIIDETMTASDFLLHMHTSWDEPEVAVRAPIVPWENPADWLNVDVDFDKPTRWIADDFLEVRWLPIGEVYALKLYNNSLKPEFTAGDHIIIDTGRAPEKGDVVVVQIGRAVTYGRYMPLGVDEHRAPIFEIRHNLDPTHIPFKRVDANNPGQVIGVVREQRRYYRKG